MSFWHRASLAAACILLSCGSSKAAYAQSSLSLSLNRQVTTESSGLFAILATVTRGGDTTVSHSVRVSSTFTGSGTNPLNTPVSVVIPAGQSAMTFYVGARQDDVYDDFQKAIITVTSSLGTASREVTVRDTTPTLSITLNRQVFNEADGSRAATGTIVRGGELQRIVRVRLSTNPPGRVKVPAEVVLSNGQRTATFPLTAIDNQKMEGWQRVVLFASTPFSFNLVAIIPLTVLDDETVEPVSMVTISSATATAANRSIQLVFTGSLSAGAAEFAANYAIRINGRAVEAESAGYDTATRTVTLVLSAGSLSAGDTVSVQASQLRDAQGRLIPNRRIVVTAR